ncbi:hypothetical protein DBR00_11480 [Pseudomonas sp. HMWF032]|uniref:hypothetical protein n=1 Tax=Pseudomonas sp. HMWF032 TaxID=2056866 RepID=UPI000D37703A|nr:hypothetical protein [Pseudomonas sp. HMWF032]PTS83996.1 hypothetical protein DBR00_11480 [Pseudomonas sp. HMWF032]PTT85351.1 hypothetical protein DBR41_04065 [Pseudomonas sp. HMWF010]
MSSIQPVAPGLPAMTGADVEKVHRLESMMLEHEQVAIQTAHHFHAGLYSRTIRIPAGVMITGALISIPTLLIVSGHVSVFTGGEPLELRGYHILPGQAGRKQVFVAHADTDLTMIFATQATTVEQAEAEFTEETNLLMSRQQSGDMIFTTGE